MSDTHQKSWLKAISGAIEGESLEIPPDGIVLGRDLECDVVLSGTGVSRRHARLSWLVDNLTIEDIGSTNGVLVNRKRIKGRVQLYPDDHVQLGDNKFLIVGGEPYIDPRRRTREFLLAGILCFLSVLVVFGAWYQTHSALPRDLYEVKIRSVPVGATVFNGGREVGKTPLDISGIAAGSYRFLLRHPGYRDLETTIWVPQETSVPIYELLQIVDGDPDVLQVSTLPASGDVYVDNMYRGRTGLGSAGSPESAPLLVPGLKRSEKYTAYFITRGRKSKTYEFRLEDGPLEMMIWQPDMIITTKHGRHFLGMLRKHNEKGDMLIAIGPDHDVWFNRGEISESQSVFPVRMRGSEGIKILGDPKSESPTLLVDPFPDADN